MASSKSDHPGNISQERQAFKFFFYQMATKFAHPVNISLEKHALRFFTPSNGYQKSASFSLSLHQ